MSTIPAALPRRKTTREIIPPLENGDHLTSAEFMRRYEAMPEIKKAELVEGIVYMASPVRADVHGRPDGLLHGWLFQYALRFSDIEVFPNTTLLLAPDNTPQPDSMMCRTPQPGGHVWLNEKGYLCGAPELVCEVAASSVGLDLREKFSAYRRNGIAEYLVWISGEKRARWFVLENQEYIELRETSGLLKSRVFPGLVLDVKALARGDAKKLIATLTKYLEARK